MVLNRGTPVSVDHVERKLAAIFAALWASAKSAPLRTLTACREIMDAHIARKRARIFTTARSAISRATLV
jgi:hypothetical protein